MKTIIIALVLISGVLSQEITPESLQTLFAAWKQQYHVQYQDEAEEARKFSVWEENYRYNLEWNAAGNTATLALNQFSDLTSEEFGAIYCGTFPAPADQVEAPLEDYTNVDIPATWDWRTQGAVTPVKDQGQCGSCWAFATVASIEGLYKINGGTLTSFSEQQIVDCDTTCDGCSGGWPYKAMQYVAKTEGLDTEANYPYKASQGKCKYSASNAVKVGVTGYTNVPTSNTVALQTAIYKQPVTVVVEADQKVFQSYSSGVITTGCGTQTDHAITAVGYGTYANVGAFFVKNSWGASWGVNGYVYIASSQSINGGAGACGILTGPAAPNPINA